MGYYSEVAICMAFEDDKKRNAFWDLLSLRDDEVGLTIKNNCQKDDQNPWINYHDGSIKWYESHPTRQAFEDKDGILDLVVECGGAWRRLVLGENPDDVEDDGDCADMSRVDVPWEAFYMVRRIEWM